MSVHSLQSRAQAMVSETVIPLCNRTKPSGIASCFPLPLSPYCFSHCNDISQFLHFFLSCVPVFHFPLSRHIPVLTFLPFMCSILPSPIVTICPSFDISSFLVFASPISHYTVNFFPWWNHYQHYKNQQCYSQLVWGFAFTVVSGAHFTLLMTFQRILTLFSW